MTITDQLIAHTAHVARLDEAALRANFDAAVDARTAAQKALYAAESALDLARYDLGLYQRQTARAAELGLTLDQYWALLDAEAAEIHAGLRRADVA